MSLRNLIEMNQSHLAHMVETNDKYTHLQELYNSFQSAVTLHRRQMNSIKILDTILNNRKREYSDEIIMSITQALTKALNVILQEKEYEIELEPYQFRNNQHLRIWLIDEDGNKLPPGIVEGDMLNQVLSFSASVILTRLHGCHWIFYDEAFASANSRSVIMIRRLIQVFMEEGFNFVFVGQNPLLFTKFDRNLIELIQEYGCVTKVIQTFVPASIDDSLDERALELHDNLLRG